MRLTVNQLKRMIREEAEKAKGDEGELDPKAQAKIDAAVAAYFDANKEDLIDQLASDPKALATAKSIEANPDALAAKIEAGMNENRIRRAMGLSEAGFVDKAKAYYSDKEKQVSGAVGMAGLGAVAAMPFVTKLASALGTNNAGALVAAAIAAAIAGHIGDIVTNAERREEGRSYGVNKIRRIVREEISRSRRR
jgi:hypothetical protein